MNTSKKIKALNAIRYEFAKNGEVTDKAKELCIENNISKSLFYAYASQGVKYYKAKNDGFKEGVEWLINRLK